VFVVAEIALAFGLLAVGGIAFEHLAALLRVQPGFDPTNLLVMNIFASNARYPNDKALVNYESALGEYPARPGCRERWFHESDADHQLGQQQLCLCRRQA